MENRIKEWSPEQLGDLKGKSYFITGGNSGIGLEAAKVLYGKNAQVVLGCRTPAKAEKAVAEIQATEGGGSVSYVQMDLSDLSSVSRAAEEIKSKLPNLSALINNAGVMAIPERKTTDGFEMQLGTNHLGHFAFTGRLFGHLKKSGGRIVNVSSIAHKSGKMNFDNLMGQKKYGSWDAYCRSKLANLLFTRELQKRIKAAGSENMVVACHPGYSATNLQSIGPEMYKSKLYGIVMNLSTRLLAQEAHLGAWPILLAAAGTEAQPGRYYGPTGFMEWGGKVGDVLVSKQGRDNQAAAKLWEVSEQLTGVNFIVS